MTSLAEQKRLLVTQCDAHRAVIQLECKNLEASFRWFEPVRHAACAAWSHRWLVGAAAGLLAARRGRSLLQWVGRGLRAWRLIRQVIPF